MILSVRYHFTQIWLIPPCAVVIFEPSFWEAASSQTSEIIFTKSLTYSKLCLTYSPALVMPQCQVDEASYRHRALAYGTHRKSHNACVNKWSTSQHRLKRRLYTRARSCALYNRNRRVQTHTCIILIGYWISACEVRLGNKVSHIPTHSLICR